MQKRRDAQIYILTHKPIDYQREDSLYSPLQVGNFDKIAELRDNTGDNISEWNPILAEFTGTYWIAKNAKDLKYKGECQYRRRIELPEDYNFEDIFKDYQAICAQPLKLNMSVYDQYSVCHNRKDMEMVEKIVKDFYPDMAEGFDRFIKNGNLIFYSNSFILPAEEFDAYADFASTVLFELIKRYGCNSVEDVSKIAEEQIKNGERPATRGLKYQQEIGGFMSERLWTLWAMTKYDRLWLEPYLKFEGV